MSLNLKARRVVMTLTLGAMTGTALLGSSATSPQAAASPIAAPSAALVANNAAAEGDSGGKRAFVPRMPRHLFGPDSEWRRDVSSAPVASSSERLVDNLHQQVTDHWNGVAAFNYNTYNVAFHQTRPGLRRITVEFHNCQNKSYLPPQLYDPARGGHFLDVPVPRNALAATGNDAQLTVYDRSTGELWEFWKATRTEEGWKACWGGRIDDVKESPGYFNDGMGTAATGLSVSGGAITVKDVRRGRIDHAMSITLIDAAHWSEFSYPAQRSDGGMPKGSANVIREGQRLRLDPDLDLSSMKLHPIARMVAEAAQTYGFIVTDKAGAVSVVTENGGGVEQRTGTNPWKGLMGGTPGYEIMRDFPWAEMQALPVDYGRPGSS